MKNVITASVIALMAGSAMGQVGQDGTVRFDSLNPYGGRNGGGEFNMVGLSGPVNLGSFISFCIELNENIRVGDTYKFDVNNAAIMGGVGGGNPDPLDARTAALYQAFAMGTLDDYDYDNSGDGGLSANMDRKLTAAALQAAIWELEEEQAIEDTDGNSRVRALANFYVDTLSLQLVQQGLGSKVRVLNMWTMNGGHAQDLLVMIPLPGASAMAGLGLLAVGTRRRRITA